MNEILRDMNLRPEYCVVATDASGGLVRTEEVFDTLAEAEEAVRAIAEDGDYTNPMIAHRYLTDWSADEKEQQQ